MSALGLILSPNKNIACSFARKVSSFLTTEQKVAIIGQDFEPQAPNALRTARSTIRASTERSLSKGFISIVPNLIGSRSLRYELSTIARDSNSRFAVFHVDAPEQISSIDVLEIPAAAGKWETPVFSFATTENELSEEAILSCPQFHQFVAYLAGKDVDTSNQLVAKTTSGDSIEDPKQLLIYIVNTMSSRIISRLPLLSGDSIAEEGVELKSPVGFDLTAQSILNWSLEFKIQFDTGSIDLSRENMTLSYLNFLAEKLRSVVVCWV
ncbi:hypothetical protein RCL1_003807 [Eukaryota sp. TZLM3-RCL]